MFKSKFHFIINPKSSGGSLGRAWPDLQALIRSELRDFTYEFTDGRGAGTKLAARALREQKPDVVVVVGGDGTVSEVVNGYFEPGVPKKKPPIAILNKGTGGDFCRTIGMPSDPHLALETIKNGRDISVDVGKLSFLDHDDQKVERYFINIAGCGMAGEVVQSVNQSSKRFSGFSYFLASAGKLLAYRNKPVRISWDDGTVTEHKIVTVAVCNGQFFGGGMQISPRSEISDGMFDVVLINDWNIAQSLWYRRTSTTAPFRNAAAWTYGAPSGSPSNRSIPAIVSSSMWTANPRAAFHSA